MVLTETPDYSDRILKYNLILVACNCSQLTPILTSKPLVTLCLSSCITTSA